MIEYKIGQIVISKSGRDKGDYFIVLDIIGEFLYLTDGKSRKLEKPKKKKMKHVQITNYVDEQLQYKIKTASKLNNAEIRSVIKKMVNGDSE